MVSKRMGKVAVITDRYLVALTMPAGKVNPDTIEANYKFYKEIGMTSFLNRKKISKVTILKYLNASDNLHIEPIIDFTVISSGYSDNKYDEDINS